MQHIYKHVSSDKPTLILLHGTGGSENSLFPFVSHLELNFNILSIRGEVNENGNLRFFERFNDGSYNLESLDSEAKKLKNFILEASENYQFGIDKVIFLGFSNGSNIALHLMLNDENLFQYGILMAPLYPLDIEIKDLSNKKIFYSMGKHGPICSMDNNEKLLDLSKKLSIAYEVEWVESHHITRNVVEKYSNWLQNNLESCII